MDCLAQNEWLIGLLTQYGSIVLFGLLMLGIVALPIPEETLLVFAGAFMSRGLLSIPGTILAAILGSICGITLSYVLGKTGGHYLAEKYGKWVGLTTKRLHQAHDWFHHLGKWSLFVGYFIPGVRHFTGFVAGMAMLEYHHFSIYAYSGAVFWIATFLSLGYFFGDLCFAFLESLDATTVAIIVSIALLLLIYAMVMKRIQTKKSK